MGILNAKEVSYNCVIIGLKGAGKTHLLYNAILEEGWQDSLKSIDPSKKISAKHIALNQTVGYNFEMFQDVKLDYGVWDIGGCNIYGGDQAGDDFYPEGSEWGIELFLKNITIFSHLSFT